MDPATPHVEGSTAAIAGSVGLAQAALRHAPVELLLIDGNDQVCGASRRAERLLHPLNQLVGAPLIDLVIPEDRSDLLTHIVRARRDSGSEVRSRMRLVRPDGTHFRVDATFEAMDEPALRQFLLIRIEPPAPVGTPDHWGSSELNVWQLGIHELISASAAPEHILEAVARMVDFHLNGISVVAVKQPHEGAWLESVAAAPAIDAAVGLEFPTSRPLPQLGISALQQVLPDQADGLLRLILPATKQVPLSIWKSPVIGPADGRVLGTIYIMLTRDEAPSAREREIARIAGRLAGLAVERQHDERWILNQTLFDPLTGLAKRSLITDRADQALLRADENRAVSMIFVGVADFHLVNSTYGHRVGDDVLIACATHIRETVGEQLTVSRFSGDEFAILVENANAFALANALYEALSRPIEVSGGTSVHLQCKIGLASATAGDTAETIMRNAHAAMQWAKQPGSAPVIAYNETIHRGSVERITLRGDLRRCVGRGELRIDYQPKLDMKSRTITGAEALLRWHHPVHGVLRPDRFIALAEETGVIVDIGEWVLRESVRQASEWRSQGVINDEFLLAVNMSARQLWSPTFGEAVAEVLTEFDWNPTNLSLELTETLLASDYDELLVALGRLKSLGVLIAADDFGTGYSALSYLDELPLDVLKVDKGFVARIQRDGTGSVVAAGVVSMAHELGLRTCAEGVESRDQLSGLDVLGCDWAQGYLIARPLNTEQFAALARAKPGWR